MRVIVIFSLFLFDERQVTDLPARTGKDQCISFQIAELISIITPDNSDTIYYIHFP